MENNNNDENQDVKKLYKHLTSFSMPKNGKIQTKIRIKEEIDRTVTFFCALDDKKEPGLHLSINAENKIWFARYCPNLGWIDVLSQGAVPINRMVSLQIFYGELGDRIFIDGSEETVLMQDYDDFPHTGNVFVSFGDVRNEDSLSTEDLVYMEDFKVIGNKQGEDSDSTISIAKPKILTEEYI